MKYLAFLLGYQSLETVGCKDFLKKYPLNRVIVSNGGNVLYETFSNGQIFTYVNKRRIKGTYSFDEIDGNYAEITINLKNRFVKLIKVIPSKGLPFLRVDGVTYTLKFKDDPTVNFKQICNSD